MNNLYKLITKLEQELDKEKCIIELKETYQVLKKDKTIIEKVNKYNYTKDEALRKDLLQNANIRKAKKMEADLNYIILEINQQFSTLKTNHRSKENESN